MRRRSRLGIPLKLLLVSSLLGLPPWLGLRLVRELQRLVLDAQEQALAATARRAAIALGDRPALLLAAEAGAEPGRVLRLLDLPGPIVVDGEAGDWDDPSVETHRLEGSDATWRIGRQGTGVYALVEVPDAPVVPRDSRAGDGDHLEIAAIGVDGELARFVVDAAADGPVSAWLLREDREPAPDNRVEGAWRAVEGGYRVELRLPRALLARRLGLAVVDVDDAEARTVSGRLETCPMADPETLAVVAAPSREIGDLLASLGGAGTRVWVVDTGKHVVAQGGSLAPATREAPDGLWPGWLLRGLARLTRGVVREAVPEGDGAAAHEVDRALSGEPATRARLAPDAAGVVLSAAHPVLVEGRVAAAVLAQETATDLLAVRGRAFDRMLGGILATSLAGVLALVAFAARISFRVERLRDGVERLADLPRGVAPAVPDASARDEIGDLSRSVAALAARQREHAAYLEQVGRRLSHELRTPVGVVRSSLDNLRLAGLPAEAAVYLDRADEGLRRLSLILARMGEATRLEQALAATEREGFDLVAVARGSVEGHRAANPGREIRLREPGEPLPVVGSPELLAQLLDKLVENALDFARPGTPVEVDLVRYGRTGALSVRNEGPRLPAAMRGRLFDSMVSVREPGPAGAPPHLGLGLHVVRLIAEFHGGSAAAHDRPDGRGVIVTVTLPLVPAG